MKTIFSLCLVMVFVSASNLNARTRSGQSMKGAHPADISHFMEDAQATVIAPYTSLVKINQALAFNLQVHNFTSDSFEVIFDDTYYDEIDPYQVGSIAVPIDYDVLEVYSLGSAHKYDVSYETKIQVGQGYSWTFTGLSGAPFALLGIYQLTSIEKL